MRVLAFDAATVTGWASFATARSCPVLGTIKLPGGHDHGARNLILLTAADALIAEHKPDVVAFEAVIFTPRDSWHERRLLCGLVGAIETAAARVRLRTFDVLPRDAKLCLTGNGRADKDDMKRAAILMGWTVADDHQADAGAVGLVTYGHFQRS